MEMRDYAAQILFGTQLEDKLTSPETLVDSAGCYAGALPEWPGRPKGLGLSEGQALETVAFPKLSSFERDHVRGQVLHFFANHELLALEIMALVLLKFSDAPRAFRRGLAQTMKDEQKHLALYLQHMERLGVGFGDVPVGGYFWRVLKTVDSPYAFTAQMGLTFEQANLDFALHFERVFRAVGDEQTASVMNEVYQDEIRHVRHGLQWFRHWKPKELSDWDAYRLELPFPLSPARAKGQVFSSEARALVGFDKEFSRQIARFNQSKGRPPRVLVYNPAQELEVGVGGLSYTQSSVLAEIAHDLEPLMLLLAARDDVVALRRPLSEELHDGFARAGIPVPETTAYEARLRRVNWRRGRKCSGLVAWGASPLVEVVRARLMEDSNAQGGGCARESGQSKQSEEDPASSVLWMPDWRNLVSKVTVVKLQNQFPPIRLRAASCRPVSFTRGESLFESLPHSCARLVTSLEDLFGAFSALFSEGNTYAVLKAPYGSSGRNQMRVERGSLDSHQSCWIKKQLSLFGALVAEPWRNVQAEFSWQASVEKGGRVQHFGMVRNISAPNGQYLASCAGKILFGLHSDVKSFLYAVAAQERLQEVASFVAGQLFEMGYIGPFGLDSYVYRDSSGALCLQRISEINLRHTMGRLALQAKRHAQAGRVVMLALPSVDTLRECSDWGVRTMQSGSETLIDSGLVRFGCLKSATRVVPCVAVMRESKATDVLRRLCPHAPESAS